MGVISFVTPHAQRERGKVIDRVVHIYIYIYVWSKKKFESYFRDRLTFSNVNSRTSRRIYRLALLLRAPETLSSLSKSRISIFNAHLTLLVRKMTSHKSIGKYRHLTWNLPWNGASPLNWKEVNIWSSTVYSCDFMKVDNNIDDVCVEFCFIRELIYSSDFHEGRQYFMLMLVLNFAF